MVSIIIKDNGEANVIQLTYENLWKEIKDIKGAELIIAKNWLTPLPKIKNTFVCFVEPDCLVNSGYFSSLLGHMKKGINSKRTAVMSSATAVNTWDNKFYGYLVQQTWSKPDSKNIKTKNTFVQPSKDKKSKSPYPVQIAYIPGALLRASTLRKCFDSDIIQDDMVSFSHQISLRCWGSGDGHEVYIAPNSTYVTTDKNVNIITEPRAELGNLAETFRRRSI